MKEGQNQVDDYIRILLSSSDVADDRHSGLRLVDIMILVLEDRRFFCHPGFDLFSIIRAFFVSIFRGNGGGASTIEQQLVRTITGQRQKTLQRKWSEIMLARKLKREFNKLDILRAYENVAYFGEGFQGIHSVSVHLFRKPVSELEAHEAAVIASCLVNPIPASASLQWSERVRARSEYALRLCRILTDGVSMLGYRTGLHGRRPYLLCESLAQAIEDVSLSVCVPSRAMDIEG